MRHYKAALYGATRKVTEQKSAEGIVASLGIQSEVGWYFKTLGEPHSADSLAMWCGKGEKETSPYPDYTFFAFSGNRSGCSIDSIPKSTSSSGQ